MRVASSFFSWLFGVGTMVFYFIFSSGGQYVTSIDPETNKVVVDRVPWPIWFWIMLIVLAVIRIIVLIWREIALSKHKKMACGICTLLFVSIIGGVLTLAIPFPNRVDAELYSYIMENKSR